MNQPRSKLKLPINELIKAKQENIGHNSSNTSLQINSKAEVMLNRLICDSSQVIPRLETINEISKELAIEANWEKAESLILNMKQDCKTYSFIILTYSF